MLRFIAKLPFDNPEPNLRSTCNKALETFTSSNNESSTIPAFYEGIFKTGAETAPDKRGFWLPHRGVSKDSNHH